MPGYKLGDMGDEIEVEIETGPEVPDDWIELVGHLHPVSACVIWAVLTGNITPETIALAKYSPDCGRFTAVAIVAGGNPAYCADVCNLAREELEEIFMTLLPNDPRRIVH